MRDLGNDNCRAFPPKAAAFRIISPGWAGAILCGMVVVIAYSNTAGDVGTPPPELPPKSVPAAMGDRHTLLMFVHPRCPCTRASVRELPRIMARCGDHLVAQVFFYRPKNQSNAWVQTDLWFDAAAIPRVRVAIDVAGAEAARFSAATSGHVLLYDRRGRLAFRGGITAARGHEGDNLGKNAIVALVIADKAHRLGRLKMDVLQEIIDQRTAELAATNQALQRQAKDLERSNAELQQFACVVSHDLQEPLRIVSSYMKRLARNYKGKLDSDADTFIAYAVDGTTRMHQLIVDLLDSSRVGSRGKEFQQVDCEQILDCVIGNLGLAIKETDAVVTHDPLPTVMADETQLIQLIQNLIGNAIKFQTDDPTASAYWCRAKRRRVDSLCA